MLARKEKRLTRQQEDKAHLYALAGTLAGDYIMARRLVELESLGRILRKRFENACNYQWACEDKYEARTEKLIKRTEEVIALLNGAGKIARYEINRDPRGSAIKLFMSADMGDRTFYL